MMEYNEQLHIIPEDIHPSWNDYYFIREAFSSEDVDSIQNLKRFYNFIKSYPINKIELTKAILANKYNLRKIVKI